MKQGEQEIEWYKALVDNSSEILMIIDEYGNIKYISPSVKDIAGYDSDSLIGVNTFIFAHPDEVDYIFSKLQFLLENPGVPEFIEFRALHKDGHWVEVEAMGKNLLHTPVKGIVVTMRDVSKIKKLEKELRRLAENVPFGIIVLGDVGVIYSNKEAERILGYSMEDFPSLEELSSKIEGEKGSFISKMKRKDGKEIWLSVRYIETEWMGEKVYLVAFSDITENLILQKRLESRTTLLKTINRILRHDLINDLTAALGMLEVYRDLREESLLSTVERRLNDAVKLIKRMRELEVLSEDGKELKEIRISEIVGELRGKYDIQISLQGDAVVEADDALFSVFDNLIRNAVVHGNASLVEIKCTQRDGLCEIVVEDDGSGIPEDKLQKVFERGVKFGKGGAMGLGLFLVKKLIERYGGNVRAEPSPKGARFVIQLKGRVT